MEESRGCRRHHRADQPKINRRPSIMIMEQYRLDKVVKIFGRRQIALGGFDLAVRKGEKVALIGPSGAGKTTLFRLLNLTLRPTSGGLWIDGGEVVNLHGTKLHEA